jgi:soluble lytic murein transglycosylase-like protein
VKEAGDIIVENEKMHLAAMEQDRIFDILSKKDPTLELYRDEASRKHVERFFIELTGSERISRPILRYADRHDVSLFLAFSVAYVESRFNARAVNKNASSVDRGVFQLNSRAFPRLKERDFFDPETSAKYGISHLKFCLQEGGNDIAAIAMYNAGKNRVTSKGAPLVTLGYISRYVEYRSDLEAAFDAYMRDKMWEKQFQTGKSTQAGLRIDRTGPAK